MNSSITTKLDELFAEWQLSCSHFVKDGIMLKPDTSIDVEEAWLHSERRIAFLLKDQNQGIGEHWDDDARLWPLYEGWPRGQMFHIIANTFYGLSHIDIEDYNQFWYGELDPNKVIEHFNHYPFAFIECKKEPGGARLDDLTLRQYLTTKPHSTFLSKEIEILNPNIIVCCGGPIFDFCINLFGIENLRDYGYNGNLKYCKSKNLIILYCEHPAKPHTNKQRYHEVTMDLLREFIKTEDGKCFLDTIKQKETTKQDW